MIGRLASVAIVAALVVGCYDLPQPACGFVCGPAGACPADYTCMARDGRCHANSAPADLVCPALDAGVDPPVDPPFVLETFPSDGSSFVPLDVTLFATFSESVTGISAASFVLAPAGGGLVAATVAYNVPSRTATLEPAGLLAPNTLYYATITAGITDFDGNPLDTPIAWAFTTGDLPDTTPPMVAMTSPSAGATGIGVDTPITATFSEEVSNLTIATFLLEDPGGPIAGTISYLPTGPSATFTPAVQLAPGTVHTATLTPDIYDFAGNPLVGAPVTWTFTTGADTVAPTLVARSPAANGTGVSVTPTITARFSEAVDGVSSTSMLLEQAGTPVAATVTYPAGIRTARLVPDAPLASSTTYTVTLTAAITDAASNPLAGAPVSWTFTTADVVPPAVVTTSPLDTATAVATDAAITVVFDEAVTNVTPTTFTVNDGAITGTLALSASDTTATFTPTVPLPADTLITVMLTTGITDGAGNALAAPVSFAFQTAP